jgi:cellulose synthase/poly-beta-1,6-N-acetylglucosamine synthase-like glycosyltransferase
MLSILIPTYNYNIAPLVENILQQAIEIDLIFEIIVLDDASSDKNLQALNIKINDLPNCNYKILDKNIGRSAIRNLLAKTAKYDTLLFLDADTMPVRIDFLSQYVRLFNENTSIIYGGILYQENKPNNNELLRWTYGKKREALSFEKRNKNKYLSFLTLNFLVKKSVFKKVQFNETIPNLRHEDTLFSYNLQQKNIAITHIDNPVYHLGLESSEIFLTKSKESIVGLQYLIKNNLLPFNYLKISSYSRNLLRLRLTSTYNYILSIFAPSIEKNLKGNKPSLLLFDLYRLYLYSKTR